MAKRKFMSTINLQALENRIRSINDRKSNSAFISDAERSFNHKQLTVMELGCLRGTLVQDFMKRGHQAIGLEEIKQNNGAWPTLYGKNLFTCDLSEEFTVYKNREGQLAVEPSRSVPEGGSLLECEFITGINVADLVPPDRLQVFFENVRKHLKIGGLFVGSVSLSEPFPQNKTLQLWQNYLLRRLPGLSFIDYPYEHIPYPAFTSFYYMLSRVN
jgi:hypothetical protein